MKTRLIVALYLSGLAALLLAAQDPGSMASRVQRPASCGNGEVLTYNSTSQQYECQPAGGGGVPAGAILLIASGTCPSGFVEETTLDGKALLGTLNAHADIGTTGGADNVTPAGTNSAPTFTGSALGTHSHTFSGSALGTHSHGVGTYAHATPTFTGDASTAVLNHTHPVTDPGHTHLTQRYPTATGSNSGFTIDTSMSGTLADNTLPTKSNTTGITTNNPAGGVASYTPTGTVSNSAFSGSSSSDSAGTPAGTNSSDSAGTPAGTVSQPTFTGTQFDNRAAFVRVIFCRKT